ncbi:MAG: threonylcarbamoyl-AMP synthase [Thermodesulfovibrionales bacterium]|nr:threonylcarbamoyl-AMP synthase [Thermodesulfovibrionales bacterium]
MDILRALGAQDANSLMEAVRVLKEGGIVAYPTETFYGLGVKYDNEQALRSLFELKGRPEGKPFSLIIADKEQLKDIAGPLPGAAHELIRQHWPGPLTLVLEALPGLSPYIASYIAPGGTVAVRVPGESMALELARKCGFAITATSANPSGQAPASTARMVSEYFPEGIDLLLDSGATPGELASTIVDLTGQVPRVLREGACRVSLPGPR